MYKAIKGGTSLWRTHACKPEENIAMERLLDSIFILPVSLDNSKIDVFTGNVFTSKHLIIIKCFSREFIKSQLQILTNRYIRTMSHKIPGERLGHWLHPVNRTSHQVLLAEIEMGMWNSYFTKGWNLQQTMVWYSCPNCNTMKARIHYLSLDNHIQIIEAWYKWHLRRYHSS